MELTDAFISDLDRLGYARLPEVFDPASMSELGVRLSVALQDRVETSVLRSRGQTYGSRNLLETFPDVISLMRNPRLVQLAHAVLGPGAGVVRVLYFDKPPDRSWSVPWHRDQTIAVQRHVGVSDHFRNPTVKAGVPHVEAPVSVLSRMLTLRVHLDAMTADNGPLAVIPGSHRLNQHEEGASMELRADVGEVLAMRPLLIHSSRMSRPGTTERRRIVHFELCGNEPLPDDYAWHEFVPLT